MANTDVALDIVATFAQSLRAGMASMLSDKQRLLLLRSYLKLLDCDLARRFFIRCADSSDEPCG